MSYQTELHSALNQRSMSEKTKHFLNPLTTNGFKHIFGDEQHKELLKELLNAFLRREKQIEDFVIYEDPEALNMQESLLTVKCRSTDGEQLIIVIRRIAEEGFREESRKFITAYFKRIAKSSQNNQKPEVTACYLLGFVDFELNENLRYLHFKDVCMMRMQNNQIFSGMLGFKFLELRNFNLSEQELEDDLEQWIYTLKNLHHLTEIPQSFKDPYLLQVFKRAEILN